LQFGGLLADLLNATKQYLHETAYQALTLQESDGRDQFDRDVDSRWDYRSSST